MHEYPGTTTRHRIPLIIGAANATAAPAVAAMASGTAKAAEDPCAVSKSRVLSNPETNLDLERTALVVIDPQMGLMSPKGVAWPAALGKSATEHRTIQNLGRLLKASKHARITVGISLTSEVCRGPGSDFIPGLVQYIEDGETIICAPHVRYSPLPRNDIAHQFRKRRVDQIIIAGMIANLGIEFHLRHFLAHGFNVAVVRDAVVGPKLPEGDGYLSSLVNFRRIANALWTIEETVKRLRWAGPETPPGAGC